MNITLPGGKRDLISKASNSIFISVALASVILAFSLVATKFLWNQMGYNSRVQAAKASSLDTIRANIDKAKELADSFEELDSREELIPGQGDKKNSEIVLDALPRKYDFPALRTSIDKLANLSGVKITSFNGDDDETNALNTMSAPTPQPIVFSVSVQGSYEAIKLFVINTDNAIRPIEILRMRFSGSDASMSATFDMTTYYQPSVDLNVQTRTVE